MSAQSEAWDVWLDRLVAGEKPTVADFARSALTDLPRVETSIRLPTGGPSVWGEEMWAEMQAIRNGEKP